MHPDLMIKLFDSHLNLCPLFDENLTPISRTHMCYNKYISVYECVYT